LTISAENLTPTAWLISMVQQQIPRLGSKFCRLHKSVVPANIVSDFCDVCLSC